jgi:triosephosphate isomerase
MKKLIVGNWKMHLNTHEASLLVHRLHKHIKSSRSVEVVIAPSFLTLQPISNEIDRRKFRLASQGGYQKDEGAFTGEVSFTMMRELVHYSIIGHSERRIYFNESLEDVRDKVQAAIRNGIGPILCVGETKNERAAGEARRVIHDQVTTALSNLTSDEINDVVIAYEPVWAISTFGGEIAKPDDIKTSIDLIRNHVVELYGEEASKNVRVLYGGSVSSDTARAYLEIDGCDGALVGGASLNYQKFASIVETAQDIVHKEAS